MCEQSSPFSLEQRLTCYYGCDDVTAMLNGSRDRAFDPERANCNNVLKDLKGALDQGITCTCKEVTVAKIKECSSNPKKPIGTCW
ncbi:hypothetical protein PBY51_014212 [Eleginops maclovinus]|uniref:Uncharacterized protein n=1 Tax=Eleginops maclovinus TaxID=56733 RepID=A0AAN7WWH9_ELEMC|nr:hypothetical protein PBY51_014212 [Eleginops maclovinus]